MSLDNNLLNKITNFKKNILNMIPIAGNDTPLTDESNGSIGVSLDYARSDHKHPLSDAYATSTHSHTITDLPTTNTITDGDTTHVVSADVIYDYVDSVIGDIEEDMLS